jgi:hypothetical protein
MLKVCLVLVASQLKQFMRQRTICLGVAERAFPQGSRNINAQFMPKDEQWMYSIGRYQQAVLHSGCRSRGPGSSMTEFQTYLARFDVSWQDIQGFMTVLSG